jgi:hypothetical protein
LINNVNNKGSDAEKFVYNISKDILLEEYCLINPYIKNSDNKEICDLLILFNDICIIVSVKNYSFNGNLERFEKKVFEKSKNQLLGAKRKLEQIKKCIITEKNSKEKEFDVNTTTKFILITLNFGHELESYSIIEFENDSIVHNLDKDTFETILFEIDSVSEIIDYLTKKEELYRKGISLNLIGKEKDLLAWFITNKREFPEKWFNHDASEVILDITGRWDFYNTNPQTVTKREANRISYFVDELVKREIVNLPQCKIIGDYLMSLNRVERRLFALTFFDHYDKNKDKDHNKSFLSRRLTINTFHDASCLMLYYVSNLKEKELDAFLQITGEIYLYKNLVNNKKIIMIATSKDISPIKFGYLERTKPYTKEEIDYYEDIIKKFGWFTSHKFSHIKTQEYPEKNK